MMVAMKKQFTNWFGALLLALTLSVGVAAPAFAQTTAQEQINNGLCAGSNFDLTDSPGECNATATDVTDKINNIVHAIVNLLSAVVGLVAVVMIIFGGFRYITSGGNDTKASNRRQEHYFVRHHRPGCSCPGPTNCPLYP